MPPTDLAILRGTLDLLLLKAVSWGPMHGVDVVRWIEEVTDKRLQIEEGALYPALHRLEERRWLIADWGYTTSGRRAKYYELSALGRKQLGAEVTRWSQYAEAVRLVLAADGAR